MNNDLLRGAIGEWAKLQEAEQAITALQERVTALEGERDDLDGRYTALMRDWQALVDEKRTLENRVDALEAEIEQACVCTCDICADSESGSALIRLVADGPRWCHEKDGWSEPEECHASPIRERRFQRQQV